MNKDQISVCIIAKNEENTIKNCIRSVKRISNQIIVIDTGSNDNTAQIASQMNAEVYYFDWDGNFSNARNESIKYASNNWILIIDCDEYIDETFNINLSELNYDIGGINLKILNYLDEDKKQISTHRYTRLFRNNKSFKFNNKIHEQIRESIELNNYKIIDSDLIIYHTGYINTSTEKKQRNKELLLKDLKNNNDDWIKFNLAETEFSLSNYDNSYKLFSELLNSNELSSEQINKSKLRLSQIDLTNENFDNCVKLLNFSSNDNDIETLRIFVLAAAHLHKGNYKESRKLYSNSLLNSSNLIDKGIIEKADKVLTQLGY